MAEDTRRGPLAPLSVAPMMDRTDRYYRMFMRQITRHTLLYTEMVTTQAILLGTRERVLTYDDSEHPVSLQLGGSDPAALAECAHIAEDWGYDEVNLNVGCPSDRVQSGSFGACLMKTPELVAECVAAMRAATRLPVTVKHRIGVDDLDRYEDMARFVEVVSATGVRRFSVHARKAWLSGLSPKENRTIPPIRYEDVYRLKRDFPHLDIEINGQIKSLDETLAHLQRVDAVMIGRAAWDEPYLFVHADRRIFGQADAPEPSRRAVVEAMIPRIAKAMAEDSEPLRRFIRPMLNLYAGVHGARHWKRVLTVEGHAPDATPDVLLRAVEAVEVVAARTPAA